MVETGESLFCIHMPANLYVNDSTIAPVNNLIKPRKHKSAKSTNENYQHRHWCSLTPLIDKGLSTLSLNPQTSRNYYSPDGSR